MARARNKKYVNTIGILLLVLIFSILAAGCKKDEEPSSDEIARNELYNLLLDWYLWYDEIPDLELSRFESPEELLEAVKSSITKDRFSYIADRESLLAYFNQGTFIGYGFGYTVDLNGDVWILYVFKDSPLYEKGIRRGWKITSINGSQVNSYNQLFSLLGPDEIGVSNSIEFTSPEGGTVTYTLLKEEIDINSVLVADTLHVDNKIVGHLVLQTFISTTADELDSAFQFFVQAGVEELVVDLRHNGGGILDISNQLASSITGPATDGEVYVNFEFNDQHADENSSSIFSSEPYALGLNRVVFLTSRGTASASESVINALTPFVDVAVIGDATYGKPVGMYIWTFQDYAFVPITFQLNNSAGFGDYFNGIPADSYIEEDPAFAFSSREEPLLKEAIHYLSTGTFTGSLRSKSMQIEPPGYPKGFRREVGAL